ncbi:multicopper oxidase family protein [Phreatobacter sp.]|uniref:multicopper oxidase family protein n=1 Tax=Phreatobacter sp. TaxID=1966341 RepID=UPI003F6F48F7
MKPFALTRRSLLAGAGTLAAALSRPGTALSQSSGLLVARPAVARLRGAEAAGSSVLTYGGTIPGPALYARQGEPFQIQFRNGLADPTSLSWHGLRIDNRTAGFGAMVGPGIAPGTTSDLTFVPPDAGSFLYRPWHPRHGQRQVMQGLTGFLVVDGEGPAVADRDELLLIQDWRVADDGRLFSGDDEPPPGLLPHLTVNGRPDLSIEGRANERLRLRIANGTVNRLVQITIGGREPWLIALDGQPSEVFPLADGRLLLAPCQRADLIIDLPGESLASVPIALANLAGATLEGRVAAGTAAPMRSTPLPAPAALPANPIAQTMNLATATRAELPVAMGAAGAMTFAGRQDREPADAPAFKAQRGAVVVLTLANGTDRFHAVQLHGHQVRLLDTLDDGWKPYFVGTAVLAPRTTTRLAFVADNPGGWPIELQPINDDRAPLIAWFQVE